MIDQTTLGHKFLMEEFGVSPRRDGNLIGIRSGATPDPDPSIRHPAGVWGLKTWLFEGPKSIGSLWAGEMTRALPSFPCSFPLQFAVCVSFSCFLAPSFSLFLACMFSLAPETRDTSRVGTWGEQLRALGFGVPWEALGNSPPPQAPFRDSK